MRNIWHYAGDMLKYRGALMLAMVAALLSAGGLGAGLAAMGPVLRNILSPTGGKDLPELATDLNTNAGHIIPAGWIAQLPSGRYEAVLWIIIALGLLTIFGAGANFLHSYLSYTIASRTVADIRKRVFGHVIRMPLRRALTEGPSALVSRVIFDTWQLWGGFIGIISKAVGQILRGIAALGVAFWTDWRLAAGGLAVGLLLGVVIKKLGTKVRRASRKSLEAYGKTQRVSNEAIGQLRVVKTSSAEPREDARFAEAVDEFLHHDLKVRSARSLSSPLVEAVGIIVLGTMAIIPAKAIIDGRLEADQFILTLASLGVAAACFKPLTGLYNELQVAGAAAGRLRELEQAPLEPGQDATLPPLARHTSSIEFKGVVLRYPNTDHPALDGASLHIRHGETVAIVGPNGCGKTTLLSLLPRLFEPDAGTILIDGVDIARVSIGSLRAQIGVVTQDAALFTGTIGANIAYATAGASEEQVRTAARKARAEEFILAKPDGYDTLLGEGGSGLSGGQRQRLCIARAVLRDPAILILDEATSMIDADSEQKIADALAEFSRGRTCLIVAHRLSTVVHADRIVVMNQGRIEDVGRHAELLERSATYRLIASTQLVSAPAMG
jgi:ABC-type multidrug transport system fused ATPase/permease subunit